MKKTFEAVYENGVLRPLENLGLANCQRVQISIAEIPETNSIAGYFELKEWEAARHDDISLEDVRRALSSIQGPLSDAVIASREERL